MILKTQSIGEKIDNLDFIKIQTFALQKIPLRKLEDMAQTGRKYMYIIYLSDKGLIFRIYRTLKTQ